MGGRFAGMVGGLRKPIVQRPIAVWSGKLSALGRARAATSQRTWAPVSIRGAMTAESLIVRERRGATLRARSTTIERPTSRPCTWVATNRRWGSARSGRRGTTSIPFSKGRDALRCTRRGVRRFVACLPRVVHLHRKWRTRTRWGNWASHVPLLSTGKGRSVFGAHVIFRIVVL